MAERKTRALASPSPLRGRGARGEGAKRTRDANRQEPSPPLRKGGKFRCYDVAIANRQRSVSLDVTKLRRVAEQTLLEEQVTRAEISIALVNDAEIWRVNKQFLNHDYPTDVVSFLLEVDWNAIDAAMSFIAYAKRGVQPRGAGKTLSGEIVIGAAYAAREAAEYGWPTQNEVILYLVHGLLHLCGYDDLSPPEKRIMRRREDAILNLCGLDRPPRRKARQT